MMDDWNQLKSKNEEPSKYSFAGRWLVPMCISGGCRGVHPKWQCPRTRENFLQLTSAFEQMAHAQRIKEIIRYTPHK
jgi:hypothetical protein